MTKPANTFPHFDAQTAASQGNAILGIRDSGKSYTAIAIAERYFDAGIPWIALDPSGRWRFIRVPGLGDGYPVVVAGGQSADLPLTVDGAPALVRAAMESGISLVLDLYDVNISKADWKRIVADVVRSTLKVHDMTKTKTKHIRREIKRQKSRDAYAARSALYNTRNHDDEC